MTERERMEQNPDALQQIGATHNQVALEKLKQPGGPEHHHAMERLTKLVANTPGALELLKGGQGRI